jgi:hypothetical protein
MARTTPPLTDAEIAELYSDRNLYDLCFECEQRLGQITVVVKQLATSDFHGDSADPPRLCFYAIADVLEKVHDDIFELYERLGRDEKWPRPDLTSPK